VIVEAGLSRLWRSAAVVIPIAVVRRLTRVTPLIVTAAVVMLFDARSAAPACSPWVSL